MSYWVYLGKTKPVTVNSHSEGGTYVSGGTSEAELNITYNYSKHYYKHLCKEKGLRWLHDKRAKDVIGRLRKAVKILGTERNQTYWESTEGNAGYALAILLNWAVSHPMAKFIVH